MQMESHLRTPEISEIDSHHYCFTPSFVTATGANSAQLGPFGVPGGQTHGANAAGDTSLSPEGDATPGFEAREFPLHRRDG